MTAFLVADVGNSRVKWGRCAADRVEQAASLPLDQPAAWIQQLTDWGIVHEAAWFLAGVSPEPLARLAEFLRQRGHEVTTLASYRQLPVKIDVEQPERVGIDRLLNAIALTGQREVAWPVVIVDAGSAVTVDLVDAGPVFRGGAIFPGLHLMAQALHGYTAQLPLVAIDAPQPRMPGRSTEAAILAGIHGAVVGGILHLIDRCSGEKRPSVVLTGGDGPWLARSLAPRLADRDLSLRCWPWMTLEGLRMVGTGSRRGAGGP